MQHPSICRCTAGVLPAHGNDGLDGADLLPTNCSAMQTYIARYRPWQHSSRTRSKLAAAFHKLSSEQSQTSDRPDTESVNYIH
jgi:hypothetical protein